MKFVRQIKFVHYVSISTHRQAKDANDKRHGNDAQDNRHKMLNLAFRLRYARVLGRKIINGTRRCYKRFKCLRRHNWMRECNSSLARIVAVVVVSRK